MHIFIVLSIVYILIVLYYKMFFISYSYFIYILLLSPQILIETIYLAKFNFEVTLMIVIRKQWKALVLNVSLNFFVFQYH